MRATPVLAACLFVAPVLFGSGFLSAFALVSEPTQQHLSNLHSPDLWPADVKRVHMVREGRDHRVAGAVAPHRSDAREIATTRVSLTVNPSGKRPAVNSDRSDAASARVQDAGCSSRSRSDGYASASLNEDRKTCLTPISDLVNDAGFDAEDEQGLVQRVSTGERRPASRCRARYASYRASDNTYQPFRGARRPCTLDDL